MIFSLARRGARPLASSVQSLYYTRIALATRTSVCTARGRLYTSFPKHSDSEGEKKVQFSGHALVHGSDESESAKSSHQVLFSRAELLWKELGYKSNEIDREKSKLRGINISELRDHVANLEKDVTVLHDFTTNCISYDDSQLANRILRDKLGVPQETDRHGSTLGLEVPDPLQRRKLTNHMNNLERARLMDLLLFTHDTKDLKQEARSLREKLDITSYKRMLPNRKVVLPSRARHSVRDSWEWLLLKVEEAKRSQSPETSADKLPPASASSLRYSDVKQARRIAEEVKALTEALAVLKSAMGVDSGANTVGTDKSKPKPPKESRPSPLDSRKTITLGKIEERRNRTKAREIPGAPPKLGGNLTASEKGVFQALQSVPVKNGTNNTTEEANAKRPVESNDKTENTSKDKDTSKSTKKKRKDQDLPKPIGKDNKPYSIHYVKADELKIEPIQKSQPPVPRVQYGLERVLFNPGVYQLQCPRTRVYNFDPYLERIMPTDEFDFNALKQYVTSSKDQTLIQLASGLGKKYTGSTSSMTTVLAHFHYLISSWRPINTSSLTRATPVESHNFTRTLRTPAAVFLHNKDGTYAIDADKQFDKATILSMLGKSMEKLLTLPKEQFENYHRDKSHTISEAEREQPEAFHYTTLGDFLMRSQLDAYNPRLPGTGMFDLKTRAVLSIRMESHDPRNGLGYEIRKRFGEYESFEREYLDMMRSAFLKYSMQVRMGRMDGIFVAFHNTERIFGFQYVPLEEMDQAIHGTSKRRLGDDEFKLSLALLNKVLNKATQRFPGKSLRLHFETRPSETPFMYIFAKPVSDCEIREVQEANKAAIEKFEKDIIGLLPRQEPQPAEEERATEDLEIINEDEDCTALESPGQINQDMWAGMMARVEDAMDDDERGIATVREAIERALEECGLLVNLSPEKSKVQIDALLLVITSPDLEATAKGIQTAAIMEEDDVNPGNGAEVVEEEIEDVDKCNDTENGSVTADVSKGIAIDSAAEEYAETEVREPSTPVTDNAEMSLKDIILKLASQVKRTSTSELPSKQDVDNHVTPRYTLRIKRFERILSEMLPSSKDGNGDETTPADIEARMKEADNASNSKSVETSDQGISESKDKDDQLLGMVLTTRNMIGGRFVERLTRPANNWSIAYSIEELKPEKAQTLYAQVQSRRQEVLSSSPTWGDERTGREKAFFDRLQMISKAGKNYRQLQNELAQQQPVYVFGQEQGKKYSQVFGNRTKDPEEDGGNDVDKMTMARRAGHEENADRGFVDRQ